MANTTSNVTPIESKQPAPPSKFTVAASLDGFPIQVEVECEGEEQSRRVSASNRNGLVQYDRQEYAARLKVAAKEVGVIGDDDLPKERGRGRTSPLPSCRA